MAKKGAKGKRKGPPKGVTPPHLRKYLFKKGHNSKSSTSSPGRSSSRRRASSSKKSGGIVHRAKGFLGSVTPKRAMKAVLILDGLNEAYQNSQRQWGGDPYVRAQQMLMPIVDAAVAAKSVGKAADTAFLAPGLTGEVLNWNLAGAPPKVTLRRAVNAAPSVVGWVEAYRRYKTLRAAGGGVRHENLMPRTAALTGIRVRNSWKIGGPTVAPTYGTGAQTIVQAAIASPVLPAAVGGAGSKLLQHATKF